MVRGHVCVYDFFTFAKFSSSKMFVKPPPSLWILLCVVVDVVVAVVVLSKLTNGLDEVKPAFVPVPMTAAAAAVTGVDDDGEF